MKVTAIRTVAPRSPCLCRVNINPAGCEVCNLYRCAGCKRWRPWSDGAADDMPNHCDDCWAKAHKVAS